MLYNFINLPKDIRLCPVLRADRIRRPSKQIEFSEDPGLLQELVWKMIRACVSSGGIGLAAPQIGVFKRMFVVEESPGVFRAYINPSFTAIPGSAKSKALEACLSVPGKNIPVSRFVDICASWFELTDDGSPEEHKETFTGHAARVFQHELDHTSGIDILMRNEENKKSFKR